jgi:hypothetical protein
MNICFDCKNARADLCQKVRDGTPIEGWVATKNELGINVQKCPNFVCDYEGFQKIHRRKACEMFHISNTTFRESSFDYLARIAMKYGYLFIRTPLGNTRYNYYIAYIGGKNKNGKKSTV